MNSFLKKIWLLFQPYLKRSVIPFPLPIFVVYIATVIIALLPKWSDQAHALIIPLPGSHTISLPLYGSDKEQAVLLLLNQWLSWVWVSLIFLYVLPRLLFPLGDSSLVSQVLWLRLTHYYPREIALVKALWVLYWGLLLALLSSVWIFITTLSHHVAPLSLFQFVMGQVGYVLLCGGLLIAFDSIFKADLSGKRVISTVVLVAPIMLLILYLGFRDVLPAKLSSFFPYAAPFTWGLRNNVQHFFASAVVGIFLLILNVVIKSGKVVKFLENQ